MSVSIKPLEDRIVVKSLEAEQTTASGLVIPDTAKEKPQEGEVLAVGPGRIDDKGNRVPLDVKAGDRVIYSKYGGTEVKHGGAGVPHPVGPRRARRRRLSDTHQLHQHHHRDAGCRLPACTRHRRVTHTH